MIFRSLISLEFSDISYRRCDGKNDLGAGCRSASGLMAKALPLLLRQIFRSIIVANLQELTAGSARTTSILPLPLMTDDQWLTLSTKIPIYPQCRSSDQDLAVNAPSPMAAAMITTLSVSRAWWIDFTSTVMTHKHQIETILNCIKMESC